MHRGVRRSAIFEDETDYQVMLQMIKDCREISVYFACVLFDDKPYSFVIGDG